jgi:hypothetical protein
MHYLNEGMAEVFGGENSLATIGEALGNQVNGYIERFGHGYTRGMLQRAGRAGLYYWIRDNAESSGWQDPEFRLLSFRQKLNRGISDITKWLAKSNTCSFQVTSSREKMVIHYSSKHPVSQMDCAFFLGLFQEYFSWVASGKYYPASEIECSTNHAGPHSFEISLNPLD